MTKEGGSLPWNGGQVRALRRAMGLTQRELAQVLGTRQQTISEWERGLYRPRGTATRLLSLVAERAGFGYGEGGAPAPAALPPQPPPRPYRGRHRRRRLGSS